MNTFRLISSCAYLLLTCSSMLAESRCPGGTAPLPYHTLGKSHIGINIIINDSGPYEFMVDTGAQITVIEPALMPQLKLERTGSIVVFSFASYAKVPVFSAAVVKAGPVYVQNLQMAVEDLGMVHAQFPKVRGILGANFLTRFDFLIDYGREVLCFDDSRRMQQSLLGEHVPLLSKADPGDESKSMPALLVSVHLPGDDRKGTVLRLDSGATVPLLFVDRHPSIAIQPKIVHSNSIGRAGHFSYSLTPVRSVKLSAHRNMQIAFATPIAPARFFAKAGEDGVLPTTLFNRVFISSADQFAIFDPH
jgi:hypothetical protein